MKTKLILLSALLILSSAFAPADWYTFKEDGFKIDFPEKPTTETQSVPSAIGDLKMKMYMVDASEKKDAENMVYMVITTFYPDTLVNSDKKDMLENLFRSSIDGAVQNVQGKLLSEKRIELNGFPGRDIKVDYQEGVAILRMRMYLVKNKMYILQVITETAKESNKSIDRFLDSFGLNK